MGIESYGFVSCIAEAFQVLHGFIPFECVCLFLAWSQARACLEVIDLLGVFPFRILSGETARKRTGFNIV